MYLKRIEMQGFKSFAEPVTIEFDKGITCIVGPNGSGKSNISDAVRWVLGEQSPKMLRGGKMEEVIFAGTANRKSRGMAEVTLVLDNSDGALAVDYNEVAITRRMYRSGESEYVINNNQCRLRDIRELIMDTGIGVDGYSLIGQGKISDIISNKTESRREIFEEAAGIVMYRTRKEEAERKLKSTTDNLDRVNDIVGEIESRIDGLREDSEKATEYLELRDRHKELEINITLKNVENAELKNEYLKDDIMETAQSIQEKRDAEEDTDNRLAEAREKSEELSRLSNEARDKLLASVEEINGLTGKKRITEERLDHIEQDTVRLNDEISQLNEKVEREESNAEEVRVKKGELDEKADLLTKELETRIAKHSRIAADIAEAGEKIDGSKNEIFRLHSQISSKKSEISSMDALRETLKKRREEITSEKNIGEGGSRETMDTLNRIKAEKEELAERLSEAESEKEENIKGLEKERAEERELSLKIEDMKVRAGQLAARKKTIEEMEANYEGYNHAVRFIMKEKIKGIIGVVAELIDVPRGMETAIETALGGKLQNIVCEDDACAKVAIARLKEKSAGRLTFLPLSSIRPDPIIDEDLFAEKGYKGYGTDCVKFDPKYKNVMEYLLGRTVVADNMDNAVAMSKKGAVGLKYVTLEGEFINASGAVTGGKFKNKSANILERRAEISELEKELKGIEKEQKLAGETIDGLREAIEKRRSLRDQLEEKFREIQIALMARENEIKAAEITLADFRSSEEKWQREMTDIERELKVSDDMEEKLRKEIAESEEKIAGLEEEVRTGQEAMEGNRSLLDEASEAITKARIEAGAADTEKQNADALVERIENALREFRTELELKKEQLASITAEKEDLSFNDTDIEEEVRQKEEVRANLEKYIQELSDERAEVTETTDKLEKESETLKEELTTLQNTKYDMEIKKAKQETQIDNLKNKLWENYEISYVQALEMRKKDFVMSPAVRESRAIAARMRELGDVNIGAIKEYESVSERYTFLTEQRDDILKSMDQLKSIISDMDKTIRAKFKESFDKVVVNFEQVFKELFGGGYAQLLLEDENDPLTSPIEIVAQPPGKALKNINLLSGGEKSLTAIALMFAVLKTKPTPFCILDEVEAALDDVNIERFGDYLRSSFDGIQFALVTHKKGTMEHADALYGVTMPEQGVSKILSLKMDMAAEIAEG